MENNNSTNGKYSYEKLTRIIHEKARLGILTSLFANKKGLSFNDLKALCNLSDGNLSRHMLALENYEFVEVIKGFEGRKPKTMYKITAFGETEFLKYLAELEKVVIDAHKAMKNNEKIDSLGMNPKEI